MTHDDRIRVRLSIVMEPSATPRPVNELVEALGVGQPLISQHLRVARGSSRSTGAIGSGSTACSTTTCVTSWVTRATMSPSTAGS